MTAPEFTLLENGLREPFLDMVKKYGKQKYTLWTVWTYMKWRSNNDVFSLPEGLVREDLGIDVNVLRDARAILIKEGWLEKDSLRDTGGEYLTRTWLVTAPPRVYHSMGMQPPRVFTTEGKSPYSGSSSCSGSGSSSLSSSGAATLSDSNKGASRNGVPHRTENIKAESNPNLEPEPKPKPAPSMAKPKGHGQDGTPYPEEFNDWSNLKRLHWLEAHGWDQGSMAQTAERKTDETVVMPTKPTPTATLFASSPHSAAPPRAAQSAPPSPLPAKKCPGCGGREPCRDKWCYCYEPEGGTSLPQPQPGVRHADIILEVDDFDA
jgi:hypothetical protein